MLLFVRDMCLWIVVVCGCICFVFFFFSSRRRHTRLQGDWSSDVCSSDLTSWFDWTLLAKRADVHRFVTLLNARRVLQDIEHERWRVPLNQLIRSEERR